MPVPLQHLRHLPPIAQHDDVRRDPRSLEPAKPCFAMEQTPQVPIVHDPDRSILVADHESEVRNAHGIIGIRIPVVFEIRDDVRDALLHV